MEFVKKEWQSVSCGLLLLFSLVSCQVAFSRFETISPYHLGYGYLAVLSVFVVSFFAYVIQTLSDYGFFADMRRFGSIFLGASSESSSEPIYIGQDSFFGVSGLPNYYAG